MTQNKKLKIALTGGIASGKSTVLNRFKELGIPSYNADEIYHNLLKNSDFVQKISDIVGVNPIKKDGCLLLDRKAVSEIVFHDKDKLNKLNTLTHSEVYKQIDKIFIEEINPIVLFEIPLLFESGYAEQFDKILIVLRDKESRIKSAVLRDNTTYDEVVNKINNQYNYDNLPKIKHTVIYNDGTIAELNIKVDNLVAEFRKKIKNI